MGNVERRSHYGKERIAIPLRLKTTWPPTQRGQELLQDTPSVPAAHLGEKETSSSKGTKKISFCLYKATEMEGKNLSQKGVKSSCNYQAGFLFFCAVFFVCHGCKLGLVVEMATAVNFKE